MKTFQPIKLQLLDPAKPKLADDKSNYRIRSASRCFHPFSSCWRQNPGHPATSYVPAEDDFMLHRLVPQKTPGSVFHLLISGSDPPSAREPSPSNPLREAELQLAGGQQKRVLHSCFAFSGERRGTVPHAGQQSWTLGRLAAGTRNTERQARYALYLAFHAATGLHPSPRGSKYQLTNAGER